MNRIIIKLNISDFKKTRIGFRIFVKQPHITQGFNHRAEEHTEVQ